MYQGQLAAVSNRADFERVFEAVDEETGDLIDLTSATIVFDISEPGCRPRITATTDNGKVTLVEDSAFRVFISRDEMSGLCAGQYDVGSTIENAGQTESLIIGSMAVLDGKVSV